jgi:hypothetical protein
VTRRPRSSLPLGENARVDESLLDDAQQVPGTAADTDGGTGPRLIGRLRTLGVPLGVAAASVLLSCLMLHWLATPGETLWSRFHVWDAQFYVQIAQQGYPSGYSYTSSGQLAGSNLAFFPLYPVLIRIVHGLTGLAPATAALVVAWVCAAVAAVVVHRLVTRLYSARVAGFAVALVFCQPMAVSLWLAYTESLFLALAAGALLAMRKESWIWAGVLSLGAGLTRSTGLAVAAALVVAVLLAVRRERRLHWRMALGCAVGCVGTPAYLAWVGLRVGQLDGWSRIQSAGWGTSWDWGSSTLDFLTATLHDSDGWVPVSVAFVLVGYALATVVALLQRPWPPLAVYGVLIVVAALGQSNFYHSKPRLLVPVLLAVLPLASALARSRRSGSYPVLAGLAFFGTWFGAYMLTVWPYAI